MLLLFTIVAVTIMVGYDYGRLWSMPIMVKDNSDHCHKIGVVAVAVMVMVMVMLWLWYVTVMIMFKEFLRLWLCFRIRLGCRAGASQG